MASMYNNVNISKSEWNYGYDTQTNNYPLEQLNADIEKMLNTDKELMDALKTLKCETEEEYYQNNESFDCGKK
jgi:hypothetical protein